MEGGKRWGLGKEREPMQRTTIKSKIIVFWDPVKTQKWKASRTTKGDPDWKMKTGELLDRSTQSTVQWLSIFMGGQGCILWRSQTPKAKICGLPDTEEVEDEMWEEDGRSCANLDAECWEVQPPFSSCSHDSGGQEKMLQAGDWTLSLEKLAIVGSTTNFQSLPDTPTVKSPKS